MGGTKINTQDYGIPQGGLYKIGRFTILIFLPFIIVLYHFLDLRGQYLYQKINLKKKINNNLLLFFASLLCVLCCLLLCCFCQQLFLALASISRQAGLFRLASPPACTVYTSLPYSSLETSRAISPMKVKSNFL